MKTYFFTFLILTTVLLSTTAFAGKPAAGGGGGTTCVNTAYTNGKLNFAVVPIGYTSSELLTLYQEDFNAIVAGFTSRQPYKARQHQLAFHKVMNTKRVNCSKSGGLTPVLTCDFKAVGAILNAACTPRHQTIVLVKGAGMTGGSSQQGFGMVVVGVGNRDHLPQPELNLATGSLGQRETGHSMYDFTCNGFTGSTSIPTEGIMGDMSSQGAGGNNRTWTLNHLPYINALLTKWAGPFIDTEAPVVGAWGFPDGQAFSANEPLRLFGSATDNKGVVAVKLFIDDKEVMLHYYWDQNSFASDAYGVRFFYPQGVSSVGPHTMQIEASDVNGNVGRSATINFYIN